MLPLIPGPVMGNQLGRPTDPAAAPWIPDQDAYDDGFLRVEHNSYYASCAGTEIMLSRKEFLMLSLLVRSHGRIVSMQALWDYVWGEGEPLNLVTLRVYVSHLRKKLLPFGLNIRTLISVGYCLRMSRHISSPGTERHAADEGAAGR